MRFRSLTVLAFGLTAAGCGSSGVQAPAAVQGTWGADCAQPFVKFDGGTIHVYSDNADYRLVTAVNGGNSVEVGYTTPNGAVRETYMVEGDTLRLDRGMYGGAEATWHKLPMKKCS